MNLRLGKNGGSARKLVGRVVRGGGNADLGGADFPAVKKDVGFLVRKRTNSTIRGKIEPRRTLKGRTISKERGTIHRNDSTHIDK